VGTELPIIFRCVFVTMYDTFTMFIKTCNYKIGLFGLLVATEKFRIRSKKYLCSC